jgi:competence ComEA-like helix-hairpin-helix protein
MRLPQIWTPAEKRLAALLFFLSVIGLFFRAGSRVSPEVEAWLETAGIGERVTVLVDSALAGSTTVSVEVTGKTPRLVVRSTPGIDPNTAGLSVLVGLPGVGPVLAGRIIEDREKNGPFRRAEDLLRVPGIGRTTLERMRSRLEF